MMDLKKLRIKGNYITDSQKDVLIKISGGEIIWIPKKVITSKFSYEQAQIQDFVLNTQ